MQQPLGKTLVLLAAAIDGDAHEMAYQLAAGLDRSAARQAAGKSPVRYVVVSDILTPRQTDRVRELGLAGVHLEERPVREPIAGCGTRALVGKVGFEGNGLLGAELIYEQALEPTAGSIEYVRDHMARPMWVQEGGLAPPQRGDNIRLSIDLALQRIAQEELIRGVEQCDAQGGRCVVIDPWSGEVLAMVDHVRDVPGLLDYQPGLEHEVPRWTRFRVIPKDDAPPGEPAMQRLRCVQDVYEPGSSFKPFVWSVITERGAVKVDDVLQTHNGSWKVPGISRTLHDVAKMAEMTWRQVLLYSSNIGMAQGALRLTQAQLRSDILRFGFGRPTGIGLPGQAAGLVTDAGAWSKYTQTSVSMGQEIAVTPLQMVRAFSIFARNGDLAGTLPNLTIRAIPGGEAAQQLRNIVLPANIALLVRDIMHDVAQRTKIRAAQLFPAEEPIGYSVFGKSGTAQVAKPTGGGYLPDQYISSFIAAAPVARPQIVVLVIIEDPGPERIQQRAHYGSPTAGPVVLRIVQRSLEYLGVPEDLETIDSANAIQ